MASKLGRLGTKLRLLMIAPIIGVVLLATAGSAGAATTSVAGNVSNGGGAVVYSTERCTTFTGGPDMQITSWPGSTMYIAPNIDDNGSWFTENYVTYPQNSGKKAFGDLVAGTCFHIAAHRDATWDFWDTSTWGGNLTY
ncbi:MAG: hypothetical protein ABR950_10285 [Candidatus Dormibacteria bacterium]|jgi:hypothetical protein